MWFQQDIYTISCKGELTCIFGTFLVFTLTYLQFLKKKHLIAVIHQNRKNGPAQCLDSLKLIILIATKLIENKEIWDSVSFINCDVVMMDSVCPSVCLLTFKKNFSSYVVPLSSKVSATIVHYFIIRENKQNCKETTCHVQYHSRGESINLLINSST